MWSLMSIYWGGSFGGTNVMSFVLCCFVSVLGNVADLEWLRGVSFPSVEGGD